ncbi:MAG: hypothetical protein HN556_19330 [Gammaproteobacteria bacterium]|jgi:tetratricopeptide (TPR) repeat protein|nr:hypothetical protein [Gammaproteobacteria bacterium]
MKQLMTLFILLSVCSSGFAATSVSALQKDWAITNYELQGDEQVQSFEQLIETAASAVAMEPSNAELLIWKAIIESTYAGKASSLTALRLVKAARADLEAAMEIDPMALDGSAYTSLGALYYQVPSWPIAFGSSKKARKLLEKAIEVNPDGIDSNYFYGAFLVEEKDYDSARQALMKAMQAPARPGRELADSGRRAEITELLNQLDES